MRMWMVAPRIMCKNHLLGEYRELFALVSMLRKQKSITGYITHNCVEPLAIHLRYLELRVEMLRRGYKPTKPFQFDGPLLYHLPINELLFKIDRDSSLRVLLNRCEQCRNNYQALVSILL